MVLRQFCPNCVVSVSDEKKYLVFLFNVSGFLLNRLVDYYDEISLCVKCLFHWFNH